MPTRLHTMKSALGVLFAASLGLLVSCQDTDLTTVTASFENASIPGDVNIKFDPTVLFQLILPQTSGAPVNVTAGVQLPRNQTAGPPLFGVTRSSLPSDIGNTFVVAAVDPDAPTPQNPTSSQIRHFLGGNFSLEDPDADGFSLLSNSTPALSEFRQPTPPAGSDPHRYVFLLFNQPDDFNGQTELNATTPVSNFNISQFALDIGLGDPLGGTFILVGPDPPAAADNGSDSSASLRISPRLYPIIVGTVASLFAL